LLLNYCIHRVLLVHKLACTNIIYVIFEEKPFTVAALFTTVSLSSVRFRAETIYHLQYSSVFNVYHSEHRRSILIIVQRDATQSSLFIILQVHSTSRKCVIPFVCVKLGKRYVVKHNLIIVFYLTPVLIRFVKLCVCRDL